MGVAGPWGFDYAPPCAEVDPETYFPVKGGGQSLVERAVVAGTCGICPGRQACLEYGVEHDGHETTGSKGFGVWGGTRPTQRAAIRSARRAKSRQSVPPKA